MANGAIIYTALLDLVLLISWQNCLLDNGAGPFHEG